MRVRSASNEARPPVVQAEESEGTTLVLLKSKLPDDLPTQAVMPATSSVEIGAESADTDSASHAPALPMLRSAPLPKTLAPAVRNTGSLDAKYIPPRAIVRTSPAYPEFAKSSHVEGDVMLLVSISSTGKVRNAKALRGNTLLAAAAENAALGWRYAPGRRNGVAVDSQMQVLVRYRLQ